MIIATSTGSIPVWKTKIPHALGHGQKKKKEKEKKNDVKFECAHNVPLMCL